MHGQLGAPDWMPVAEGEYARSYAPPKAPSGRPEWEADDNDALEKTAKACANEIKIIHEEIPAGRIELARQWIYAARRVWFVGFGYHRLNLERLGFDGTWPTNPKVKLKGTVYQHPMGDLERIARVCPRFQHHPNGDALQFMLDEPGIHE